MDTLNFKAIFLGQSVIKYEVPLDIFNSINHIYETKYPTLPPANKQLVGKIEDEVSLFYGGPNNDKMHAHSFLPNDILQWFDSVFEHYLAWNKIGENKRSIN